MAIIRPIVSFKKEPFSSNKVRARVLNELKYQGKVAQAFLALTTEYWDDPPAFTIKILYANASPLLIVFPDPIAGSWDGADHWNKINDGSNDRYVVMSQDFLPKTLFPGALGGNTEGQGGPVRSDVMPREIRARHWDELIQNEMKGEFADAIQEAIRKGLEK
jgi:hypothetical protein